MKEEENERGKKRSFELEMEACEPKGSKREEMRRKKEKKKRRIKKQRERNLNKREKTTTSLACHYLCYHNIFSFI